MNRKANRQIEKSQSVTRLITFHPATTRLCARLLIFCCVCLWISTARATAADDTEDLNSLYSRVLDIRATELDAWPPKYTHALEALDYSLRAIRLLEAGQTSTSIKADQVNSVTAYLYQTAAMVEAKKGDPDQALKYYRKSSATDPENSNLKTRNYLGVGLIYMAKYADAAKKYAELPEAKKTADPLDTEVTALLNEVNAKADDLIEAWARFLALPKSAKYGETRAKVEQATKELYKYRHQDSLEGLQELINQYRPMRSFNEG